MAYKVSVVSLGCPKNQVDAEMMLKALIDGGFELSTAEAEADAIIINTCGFIEDAKKEAIENILDCAAYKKDGKLKALIVAGCLAERYKDDITEEIPEVDLVVGIGSNSKIPQLTLDAIEKRAKNSYGPKEDLDLNAERILGGMPFTAYIKVSDGCDNCCTYCAIPKIRGRLRSRRIEDIVKEAKALSAQGVTELIVVAQDTTKYGVDLYGKPQLASLLKNLCKIEGIHWIRMLYTYPDMITDELLEVMKSEEKIVNYLDIPIQHCNKDILKKIIEDWDVWRIELKQDGDSENKRIPPKERKSKELFNEISKDFIPTGTNEPNKKKVEKWVSELDEDATFNFSSYGECFISENLLRKYITDKGIALGDKREEKVKEYRKKAEDAKNAANISFDIREDDNDLSYFAMDDFRTYLAER